MPDLHSCDLKIIYSVFCVDYCVVTHRMHSEAAFCWSHKKCIWKQNFMVAHTYGSESHSAHEKHELKWNYITMTYGAVAL